MEQQKTKFIKRTSSGDTAWKTQSLKPSERRLLGFLKDSTEESALDNLGIPDIELLVASMVRRGWLAYSSIKMPSLLDSREIEEKPASRRLIDLIEAQTPTILIPEDEVQEEIKNQSSQTHVFIEDENKKEVKEVIQDVIQQKPVIVDKFNNDVENNFTKEELRLSALKFIAEMSGIKK